MNPTFPTVIRLLAGLLVIGAGLLRQAGAGDAPELLRPFFEPPPEFAGKLGAFRSPLLFDDGTRVVTASGWPRRRAEILARWQDIMGPWPPLLEKPVIQTLREERLEAFTRRRVKLEVAAGQMQEGWLLVPHGNGPFPAVLVVYYEADTSAGLVSGDKGAHRDYALQLVKCGFVTLSIGTPGGNAWKPDTGSAACQPLAFHAFAAANVWTALGALPEVDALRIGIAGHSYGGKWAMFAAALWERFAAVAVSDPGIVWDETRPDVNYWEPWYLGLDPARKTQRKPGLPSGTNPRTGSYARLVSGGRDLTDIHALICPRPFLVSGGSEDPPVRWTALNHARAVNEMLGFNDRIAMTSRTRHAPDEESNAVLRAFFDYALKRP